MNVIWQKEWRRLIKWFPGFDATCTLYSTPGNQEQWPPSTGQYNVYNGTTRCHCTGPVSVIAVIQWTTTRRTLDVFRCSFLAPAGPGSGWPLRFLFCYIPSSVHLGWESDVTVTAPPRSTNNAEERITTIFRWSILLILFLWPAVH